MLNGGVGLGRPDSTRSSYRIRERHLRQKVLETSPEEHSIHVPKIWFISFLSQTLRQIAVCASSGPDISYVNIVTPSLLVLALGLWQTSRLLEKVWRPCGQPQQRSQLLVPNTTRTHLTVASLSWPYCAIARMERAGAGKRYDVD